VKHSLIKKPISYHFNNIKEICESFLKIKKVDVSNELLDEFVIYFEEKNKVFLNSSEKIYLSSRELDCIDWYAKGKNSAEISTILEISKRTVETHIEKAKFKLGCTNLFQLGYYIAMHRFNCYGFVPHPYKGIAKPD
jgi:DNA-binding CsgD family transcriptional regulator